MALTFCTSSDVVGLPPLKSGPPVVSLDKSYCPSDSWMSIYGGVVMVFKESTPIL